MDLVSIFVMLAQAGVQLAPILQQLFENEKKLDDPNRPDVSDEQRKNTRDLIVAIQKAINQT
jgi:hypothetical protein